MDSKNQFNETIKRIKNDYDEDISFIKNNFRC